MTGLFGLLSEADKRKAVWAKAEVGGLGLLGYGNGEWAHDAHGNLIKFSDYGDRNSPYGWEYDHHPTPRSLGGADEVSNLRPLHWRANASHGGLLGGLLGLGEALKNRHERGSQS
jgi:hypothetical protein